MAKPPCVPSILAFLPAILQAEAAFLGLGLPGVVARSHSILLCTGSDAPATLYDLNVFRGQLECCS